VEAILEFWMNSLRIVGVNFKHKIFNKMNSGLKEIPKGLSKSNLNL